jgi:hypothetical protein
MNQVFVPCNCGYPIPTGAPKDLLGRYRSSSELERCPNCGQMAARSGAFFGNVIDLGDGKWEANEIPKDSDP